MSQIQEQVRPIPSPVMRATPSRPSIPDGISEADAAPKVTITGDLRLRVTEQDAARGPVKGRYHIQTKGMQGPLQVIWTVEGRALSHNIDEIEVAFDMRGTPAGAILTRLLSVQVTERGGQGSIALSSIFIQIAVVQKSQGFTL